ncbi:hypothetical protein DFR24_3875 [Panacagrimonas perspica]|uniref:Beta-barrel porin MtrB/PioB n=1 Tax=Panacagrimonas perspica TaxID=381431 RepID=A0A4R7NZN9_9GAMM|nr:DUF1302 family protein [Panacagrimonas perspica]TDU26844.1 hypothetical protein DFR24_3875 [Panacagrimonas perspica]THD03618.1 hypothetical protein B1810_08700 [Panacagrimonas perspica]
MSLQRKRWIGAVAVLAASTATSTAVHAQGEMAGAVDRKLFGGDFSFNGQIRVETAFSTTGRASPANQRGLLTNGLALKRSAGNPVDGYNSTILPQAVTSIFDQTGLNLGAVLGGTPLGPTDGVSNQSLGGLSDTFTRYVPDAEQIVNYHLFRFEATPSINWGAWSLQTRIRATYDPGSLGYEEFNFNDYNDINRGFETGSRDAGRQYNGKPDYLGYEVDGKKDPLLFERSGKHYQVDLPAFFVEWTGGDMTVRVGNQSVAWGQLLFFRIMDQANGLDLRRHLFIDRAIEEFADERMSAPGIRFTWQATDQILVDAFAQQFIPTIVPNSNTTYNIVDSRFILHDNYFDGDYNKKFNFGVRLKAEFGNFNLQAMATSKLNQLGAIRWTKSNINKKLPDTNTLGLAFNQYCEGVLGSAAGQGCGPQLANTPFESGPAGLFTAEEWFDRAGYTKLDPLLGLANIVNEFQPTTGQLLTAAPTTAQQAYNELNAFFIALEGAHGHVERNYYREEVYGIGGGYVTEGEPGSLLDQLIINVEATYTPERAFTDIGLAQAPDRREEYQVGLVMEKYQRFSQSMPATYMVFQYLWQKESSLEGLLLDGYGSKAYSDVALQGRAVQLTNNVPVSSNPFARTGKEFTPGISEGANYVVLAALQPSNAYIFEYSFAMLIDVQGGVLVQPAVQWKPRGNMTVNLFYNFIDAEVWGGNANNSFLSFIDYADEVCLRLGYQF